MFGVSCWFQTGYYLVLFQDQGVKRGLRDSADKQAKILGLVIFNTKPVVLRTADSQEQTGAVGTSRSVSRHSNSDIKLELHIGQMLPFTQTCTLFIGNSSKHVILTSFLNGPPVDALVEWSSALTSRKCTAAAAREARQKHYTKTDPRPPHRQVFAKLETSSVKD